LHDQKCERDGYCPDEEKNQVRSGRQGSVILCYWGTLISFHDKGLYSEALAGSSLLPVWLTCYFLCNAPERLNSGSYALRKMSSVISGGTPSRTGNPNVPKPRFT
jgi:hypothetical protein